MAPSFLDMTDGDISDLMEELDQSDPAEDDARRFAKKTNDGRRFALQRWNGYVQKPKPL